MSLLRILNGEMGYGSETRPDAMGRIAYSRQNVDKDAIVEHLIEANKALAVVQNPHATKALRYAPLDYSKLKLVGIADGALRKKSEKYSQGCFYILLMEVGANGTGGRCWVVTFKTARATRVSKSSISVRPPERASGQPVGHGSPHGGPYQPLLGLPRSPNLRPAYHEPGPDSVGKPKSGGRK